MRPQWSKLIGLRKTLRFIISSCFLFAYAYSTTVNANVSDSTAITPTPLQTAPGKSGVIIPSIDCGGARTLGNPNSGGAMAGSSTTFPTSCYTELWGQTTPLQNYTATNPWQTSDSNSNYQPIVVDGDYEIVAQFEFQQNSTTPSLYWVDDWAANFDYAGVATPLYTRIFYSGDQPIVLNVGSTNSAIVYFSGRAHLKAGSKVYYPRVWSTCPDPNNCGAFTFLGDFQCLAGPTGTCSCANSTWIKGGTCFWITLLSSP